MSGLMHDASTTDLLQAGREQHQLGHVEAAEAIYRRAVEQDPTSTAARLQLGIAVSELGRPVEAGEIFGQLVVDHPDFAAGWVQLARVIASQGFAWEAHEALSRALKAKMDVDTLLAVSAIQLSILQDVAAAEASCRRATKLSPHSAAVWIQLGQVLTVKGRPARAAAAYERALAAEPANALASFLLTALRPSIGNSAPRSNQPAEKAAVPLPVSAAPPEYVRALFDGCAERFDSLLVASLNYRTPKMLDTMFSNWLARPGAGPARPLAMLDAGCGTGLCGAWLAPYRGRLSGVDLSRKMLAEAQARGVYDELLPGEIVQILSARPESVDLIVAADVLVYCGDLSSVFAAAAAALHAGGVFLFSVEAVAQGDYVLQSTQRFAHSMTYLHRLAVASGLVVRAEQQAVLRTEKGNDVNGYLLLTEKPVRAATTELIP